MKNAEQFLIDSLNRINRSIEITGTGMNYKGNRRKSIPFDEFRKRFLKEISYTLGEDPMGYYGVSLRFIIDGTELIFNTSKKRAMVYDQNKQPIIYEIYDQSMIDYLNVHFSTDFGDFVGCMYGSGSVWRDYVSPKLVISDTLRKMLVKVYGIRKSA